MGAAGNPERGVSTGRWSRDSSAMLAHAADRIHSFAPYPKGQRVILACSGGADSTFLALAWRFAVAHLPKDVVHALPKATVVIVDHGHRPGSDSDAIQALSLYSALGLPAEIRTVGAAADSNESDLRSLRYQALLQAAADLKASRILFAHHADDHAETVLLRILRGTGLAGLAGIPARRPLSPDVELLRPLLNLRSEAIRQSLRDANQPWIEDPSNADPALAARNHLRHQVLPQLDALASAEPTTALLRLSAEASEWRSARDEILDTYGDFQKLPSYLKRCVIQRHLQECGETVSPSRLRDLEGALQQRNRAGIDATRTLVYKKSGRLQVVESTAQ